jgi:hypothetical protein
MNSTCLTGGLGVTQDVEECISRQAVNEGIVQKITVILLTCRSCKLAQSQGTSKLSICNAVTNSDIFGENWPQSMFTTVEGQVNEDLIRRVLCRPQSLEMVSQ